MIAKIKAKDIPIEVQDIISSYNMVCPSNTRKSKPLTKSAMFNYLYVSSTLFEVLLKKLLFRYSEDFPFTHNSRKIISLLGDFIEIPAYVKESDFITLNHSIIRYNFFSIDYSDYFKVTEDEVDSLFLFFIQELQKANSLLEV